MSFIYEFPPAARYNKKIPKNQIYQNLKKQVNKNLKAPLKTQQLFSESIQSLVWAYKLAPSTVNISAGQVAHEIQVIELNLITGLINDKVLASIDKAIPSPLLFQWNYEGRCRYAMAYKEPQRNNQKNNQNNNQQNSPQNNHENNQENSQQNSRPHNKQKYRVGSYHKSYWATSNCPKKQLPAVLNLDILYKKLLEDLSQVEALDDESLSDFAFRIERG